MSGIGVSAGLHALPGSGGRFFRPRPSSRGHWLCSLRVDAALRPPGASVFLF